MFRHVAFAISVSIVASSALAVAPQRTFVASYGNDANTCSLPLPCRGFVAAVAQVADGGEVIVLDSAGYGSFTIDRSVAIIAPAGVYAGIAVFTGANGIDVNTAGVKVALRGLTINGRGGNIGVNFVNGSELIAENCEIAGMNIALSAATGKIVVTDSIIRNSESWGLALGGDAKAQVARSRIANNGGWGIYVVGGAGVSTDFVVADSHISGNGFGGILLTNTPFGGDIHGEVTDSTISGNADDPNAAGARISLPAAPTGTALLTLARTLVSGNNGNGAEATGSGATLAIGECTIVHNGGYGIAQFPASLVLTRGDNTVHSNALGALLGTTVSTPPL